MPPQTYRDYVKDRSAKVDAMIKKVGASPALKKKFFADPGRVAKTYGLVLSEDEVAGIRLGGVRPLGPIGDRLRTNPLAMFNSNCGCGGGGGGTNW